MTAGKNALLRAALHSLRLACSKNPAATYVEYALAGLFCACEPRFGLATLATGITPTDSLREERMKTRKRLRITNLTDTMGDEG